jgi:hypothetical protein
LSNNLGLHSYLYCGRMTTFDGYLLEPSRAARITNRKRLLECFWNALMRRSYLRVSFQQCFHGLGRRTLKCLSKGESSLVLSMRYMVGSNVEVLNKFRVGSNCRQ